MSTSRWPLIALAAIFLGPVVAAVLLYAARDHVAGLDAVPNPDRELIADPEQLPLLAPGGSDTRLADPAWARSRWSVIYARMTPCEERCADALTRLHQVYLALGQDRDRVQQVFLAPASEAETPAATTYLIGTLDGPEDAELIHLLGPERLEAGRVFVVDPRGYVILTYPPDADQKRLLEDLKRLLRYSWVG